MSELLIKVIADWLVVGAVLVGGVGFVLLTKNNRYQLTARAILAGLVALWLAKVASVFYQGERPFVLLGEEPRAAFLNNPGFPSDHTLLVFAITFIVWASTRNLPLGLVLLAISILVAIGRVAALVHSPVDILGAVACALLAATLVYGRKLYSFK